MARLAGRSIAVPGADLYVVAQGTEPHAVFVHGLGGDLHTWDGVWNALGETFAGLRYDLRDCGASMRRQRVPFRHASDLRIVLDASSIAQCDLIGVSLGGGIALNFALDHPQRVRKLILISPHIVAWEWSPAWRELWQPIVEHARAGAMENAKRLWWQHPLFDSTRVTAAGPALMDEIMRSSGEQWLVDDHEPMLPDVERLHQLATPTLLLTGGRDFEDFRLIADLIAVNAHSLRRIDEPARGHLLHLEDPTTCARRIRSFLEEERT